MQKIISCRVTDEYVQGTGAVVGAVGSHNDAALELSFSEIWDGTTKRIVWHDALGQNPTLTILTVDLLVPGEAEVYRVPIPAEAKAVAGNLMMTIRGVVIGADGKEEKAVVSATATFVVLDSVWDDDASESGDITPSQAEQLQAEVDSIKLDISATIEAVKKLDEYVEVTGGNAEAAALAEENAKKAQSAAASSATAASNSASQASTNASNAAKSAAEAKQAAVDANGVLTFNGRKGAVTPQSGDYTAAMVGAAEATTRTKIFEGKMTSVKTAGWYRIATLSSKSSAEIFVSNLYASKGGTCLAFYIEPDIANSIVVVHNPLETAQVITKIRGVYLGGSKCAVDVYYAGSASSNNMFAQMLTAAFSRPNVNDYTTMGAWTAVDEIVDGETVMCELTVNNTVSGTVLTDGSHGMDLLWKNASPTSSFAEQTIEVDTSAYRYLWVVMDYNQAPINGAKVNVIRTRPSLAIDADCSCEHLANDGAFYTAFRRITVSADHKSIAFSGGRASYVGSDKYGISEADTFAIPIYIYGIKGVND